MANGRVAACYASTHDRCASCAAVILRRTHHIHVFNLAQTPESVLCGTCYETIICAAFPVLSAVAEAGIKGDPVSVRNALQDGTVQVFVQEILTMLN